MTNNLLTAEFYSLKDDVVKLLSKLMGFVHYSANLVSN